MECNDNINVKYYANKGVTVLVTRSLGFNPEEIFSMVVSFGVNLKFNDKKAKDFRWEDLNLADEFRNNGDFVTANLMSRITLLIGQITSSFGQQPLILPPSVAKKDEGN